MNVYDPTLMAYLKFADNLLHLTFLNYEHVIRALIGKEEITTTFVNKWGNPVLEKIAIERWIVDEYSNFDSLTMGYSRDSAKSKIEAIQKHYGCGYGNMSDKLSDRVNKKIEKIFKKNKKH